MKDAFLVIGAIVLLFGVWFFAGGPERSAHRGSLFISAPHSPQILGSSKSNSNEEDSSGFWGILTKPSVFKGELYFVGTTRGAKETNPDEEYITIEANKNNTSPITITGLRLVSPISGKDYEIGRGVKIPNSNFVSEENPISLNPGERAVIVSGDSPIGRSFQLNKCTGYFEQFQDFSPNLPKSCPRPEDELVITANLLQEVNNSCIDFIERLPRCETYLKQLPLGYTNQCRSFIANELTYAGCVENHRADPDFIVGEWRVFLKRQEELWREKRELIQLVDTSGKVIDTFSY